jgi:hypothetical protein
LTHEYSLLKVGIKESSFDVGGVSVHAMGSGKGEDNAPVRRAMTLTIDGKVWELSTPGR